MIGKELKALRESLGLSRRQVAIILDVSESTVKHCENDIRSNDSYVKGIKLLHDGLTQPDNRVKSGLYADWRTNPKAHLKALKEAVEAERERIVQRIVDAESTNGFTYPDGTIDEDGLRKFVNEGK